MKKKSWFNKILEGLIIVCLIYLVVELLLIAFFTFAPLYKSYPKPDNYDKLMTNIDKIENLENTKYSKKDWEIILLNFDKVKNKLSNENRYFESKKMHSLYSYRKYMYMDDVVLQYLCDGNKCSDIKEYNVLSELDYRRRVIAHALSLEQFDSGGLYYYFDSQVDYYYVLSKLALKVGGVE